MTGQQDFIRLANDQLLVNGDYPAAVFSECGAYRYFLSRRWASGNNCIVWICLNPSTADHQKNDPTVTRLCNFSRKWGYDSLRLLNIFALRSTDPRGLKKIDDPIGPDNDWWFREIAHARGQDIVCAWGVHGNYMNRGADVMNSLLLSSGAKTHVLGWTKSGMPKHPLYLAADTERVGVTA